MFLTCNFKILYRMINSNNFLEGEKHCATSTPD